MKRLWKSRNDRMIDGVCGGIAEYAGIDATLVRVGMVLLAVFGGVGFLLYLAGMILMPVRPGELPASTAGHPSPPSPERNGRVLGAVLLAIGIWILLHNLGFHFWRHWWGISWEIAVPLVLIAVGVAFIFGGKNLLVLPSAATTAPDPGAAPPPSTAPRKLTRSRTEKKLFGVCGGLGLALQIDPVVIRLLFVLGAVASFGIVLLAYVVLAIAMPKEQALPVGA